MCSLLRRLYRMNNNELSDMHLYSLDSNSLYLHYISCITTAINLGIAAIHVQLLQQ
jgi:hypothetical protein